MIRPPFALDKMERIEASGTIIDCAKKRATLKRSFQVLPRKKCLYLLVQQIPDKNEHSGPPRWCLPQLVSGQTISRELNILF